MKQSGEFWLYVRIAVLNVATLVMFFSLYLQVPSTAVALSRVPKKVAVITIRSGIPKRLVISGLGLDLSVGDGAYNPSTRSWVIDDTKAFFADVSVPANDHNGTTLIYGHGQRPIFDHLQDLRPGEVAQVYTDTGYLFTYDYQSERDVVPSDTSVLDQNGKPSMVLQTCTGAWDSYRALYYFKLDSVAKP